MAQRIDEDDEPMLAAIWQRHLPVVIARLELLDRAATAKGLSDELREEAGGAAHKLAGSLGMYGYVEGTRIAREIEVLLLDEDRTRDLSRLGELAAELRQTIFPVDPA
jgi:HPt (histidine-containing phosphotransfer) domain-containing protein